ncbi:hypothetical protein Tco_1179563 [Tanacetum coccineum]
MTNSKSFNRSLKQRALYHALVESILEDEDTMDKGVANKLKKRKPDDANKDEGPSARSDRRKTLATSSKSSKFDKSAKDQVIEPISVQDSDNAKHDDAGYVDMPMDQGEDLGNTNEQPNDEAIHKNDWYKKSRSDSSPDLEWNEGKSIDDGPEQSCQIVPANFFFNNDLEYLRGGSNDKKYTAYTTKSKAARFELKGIKDMVPNLWSPVKVVYDKYALLVISHWQSKRQNFYGYTTKLVSKYDVYSTKRILSIICVKVNEWYMYGYLEEILVKRVDQKLYTFKESDFKRLRLNDIEDMLLLII